MEGPREDGRAGGQTVREIGCVPGVMKGADGSAKWWQGSTSVVAAVHGPLEMASGREDAERASVEVVFTFPGQPRAEGKLLEDFIAKTIAGSIVAGLHPRTVVQVVIQVLAEDGSLLACSLNAAWAALVDAGVPLRVSLAVVAAAVTSQGAVLLDPTKAEECAASGSCCIVADVTQDRSSCGPGPPGEAPAVAACLMQGQLSTAMFHDVIRASWRSAALVDSVHRRVAGAAWQAALP